MVRIHSLVSSDGTAITAPVADFGDRWRSLLSPRSGEERVYRDPEVHGRMKKVEEGDRTLKSEVVS